MKVAVHSYHAGKAWLCICVGVEPPFSKSWIRHWHMYEHCCLCLKVEWKEICEQSLHVGKEFKR